MIEEVSALTTGNSHRTTDKRYVQINNKSSFVGKYPGSFHPGCCDCYPFFHVAEMADASWQFADSTISGR